MNRLLALNSSAVPILAAIALAPFSVAGQGLTKYAVAPGSVYTYKPSPWLPIPGGQPSPEQLDFGVSGVLVGTFLSADIALAGNEAIQSNPRNEYTPVTATQVAEFLETRSFTEVLSAPEYTEYAAHWPNGLRLRLFNNGNLTLTGGCDGTPVDGDAMLFNVSATPLMPGDYNGDGMINDRDFNIWKENFGSSNLIADGNQNGYVDSADYVVWRKHASTGAGSAASVPEPTAAALLTIAAILSRCSRTPGAAKWHTILPTR